MICRLSRRLTVAIAIAVVKVKLQLKVVEQILTMALLCHDWLAYRSVADYCLFYRRFCWAIHTAHVKETTPCCAFQNSIQMSRCTIVQWARVAFYSLSPRSRFDAMTRLRVLLAEDDALISLHLSDLLVQMGYEVCAAVDSEAAMVAAAAQYRPNLMLVDARLGAGSGIAAVKTILLTEFIPHIFVSGMSLRDEDVTLGAVILQKPFNEFELERALRRALGPGAGDIFNESEHRP
jgi:CheY-like chemotaxis protein